MRGGNHDRRQEKGDFGMKKLQKVSTDTAHWEQDKKEFRNWFRKQKWSLGAIPSWTTESHMERVWCIARRTLRTVHD